MLCEDVIKVVNTKYTADIFMRNIMSLLAAQPVRNFMLDRKCLRLCKINEKKL